MSPHLLICSLSLLLALPAFAVDGVLEIHQTCATPTGCFAGAEAVGLRVEGFRLLKVPELIDGHLARYDRLCRGVSSSNGHRTQPTDVTDR